MSHWHNAAFVIRNRLKAGDKAGRDKGGRDMKPSGGKVMRIGIESGIIMDNKYSTKTKEGVDEDSETGIRQTDRRIFSTTESFLLARHYLTHSSCTPRGFLLLFSPFPPPPYSHMENKLLSTSYAALKQKVCWAKESCKVAVTSEDRPRWWGSHFFIITVRVTIPWDRRKMLEREWGEEQR